MSWWVRRRTKWAGDGMGLVNGWVGVNCQASLNSQTPDEMHQWQVCCADFLEGFGLEKPRTLTESTRLNVLPKIFTWGVLPPSHKVREKMGATALLAAKAAMSRQ